MLILGISRSIKYPQKLYEVHCRGNMGFREHPDGEHQNS
jgi:hypothetical protein